jgi:outer membrane protein assembly factor BamB
MNLSPAVSRLLLPAAFLVLAAAWSAAEPAKPANESWPMFGGTPARNLANPNAKNVPTDWKIVLADQGEEKGKLVEKESKNVKWAALLGSNSYGGPSIAGGRIFVGTNNARPRDPKITADKGVIMCFEEATGKFLWQALHDKLPNPSENDYPEQGIASTPTVDGDRLYYVSNRCEVICATTKGKPNGTADIVWALDMIKEFNVYPCHLAACSPLVVGDLVFVVTGNGINPDNVEAGVVNPKAPSFLAVNKTTGKKVWTSNLPGANVLDGQWSNPVWAEVDGKGQVIFPGGDGWLYSFEPKTGELLWKFDCNPKKATPKERSSLIATPVVVGTKLYVGVGKAPDIDPLGVGHLWCVDVSKGKGGADVSPKDDNLDPKAPENKDSALVWHYGGKNPDEKARKKYLFNRTIATCAVHDGLVYAADFDGYLYCLDAATGQKYWEKDVKATVWGALAVMDGKVYIGTENGEMWIFPAGKTPPEKELARVDVGESVKGAPVFANGVLYVQTDSHLFAIQAK